MRQRRHSRGQSLVEFALILPVFVLILFGIFDLGRAVFANSTVNNAAREGARHAIVDQSISDIQATAASSAVSLGIDATAVDVDFRAKADPGTPDSCDAERPGDDNNLTGMTQCIAVVTVEYDYSAATPVIGQLIGDITLTGESHFPVGFNCEGPECPIGD